MQLVSSRIWTRVAVSISYDDNHYTTASSDKAKYYIFIAITPRSTLSEMAVHVRVLSIV